MLLDKLMNVAPDKKLYSPAMYKQPAPVYMPKSLNIAVRKKENLRIEKENMALAKKLFTRTSNFKKTEFDRFYAETQVHKGRI